MILIYIIIIVLNREQRLDILVMDKIQIFRFTNEELKKINQMVPKGYKFIPKDQLNNKNAAQKHYKKNSVPQITVIPPVQ